MLQVLGNSWALLIGILLLQIGNGLQGTALGIRGAIEGFDSVTMGIVMSGYFAGFFGGAQLTPRLLRRVGHVRVFAALASLISAAFIIYAWVVDPWAWTVMRLMVGFCFSGVYVVAESWLNNQADNTTRGKTLSLYVIAQMLGIIVGQAVVPVFDPAGFDLFVIMSVAVSISFAPILLSVAPVPPYESARALSLRQLFHASPLGSVGALALGAVFACIFAMSAVYGAAMGMTPTDISAFVGAIYLGGLVLQFPIGWLSDRMDRRQLIAATTAILTLGALLMVGWGSSPIGVMVGGFIVGGMANPLYSLLIAHTNDFIEREDMPGVAGGLVLLNGLGACGTPVAVGFLMERFGPQAFPAFMGVVMLTVTIYALYRMTVRPSVPVEETLPIAAILPVSLAAPSATAQEHYAEQAEQIAGGSGTDDAHPAPEERTGSSSTT